MLFIEKQGQHYVKGCCRPMRACLGKTTRFCAGDAFGSDQGPPQLLGILNGQHLYNSLSAALDDPLRGALLDSSEVRHRSLLVQFSGTNTALLFAPFSLFRSVTLTWRREQVLAMGSRAQQGSWRSKRRASLLRRLRFGTTANSSTDFFPLCVFGGGEEVCVMECCGRGR